jgi:hypothetical protein
VVCQLDHHQPVSIRTGCATRSKSSSAGRSPECNAPSVLESHQTFCTSNVASLHVIYLLQPWCIGCPHHPVLFSDAAVFSGCNRRATPHYAPLFSESPRRPWTPVTCQERSTVWCVWDPTSPVKSPSTLRPWANLTLLCKCKCIELRLPFETCSKFAHSLRIGLSYLWPASRRSCFRHRVTRLIPTDLERTSTHRNGPLGVRPRLRTFCYPSRPSKRSASASTTKCQLRSRTRIELLRKCRRAPRTTERTHPQTTVIGQPNPAPFARAMRHQVEKAARTAAQLLDKLYPLGRTPPRPMSTSPRP